jgi:hypothetical protein
MISNAIDFVKKATWFLNSGVSPDGVSEDKKKELSDVNHMESKKFAMTMIALSVIAIMYFSSVCFLFVFKQDPQVAALVSMYKDMIVAVASIAGTLVGIQGLVDWKYNSSSAVDVKSETIKQEILQTLTHNTKEEDYDISEVHV